MSPRTYPTEDAAFRRVEVLKARFGIWTAIRRTQDGWELLHDPEREGDAK